MQAFIGPESIYPKKGFTFEGTVIMHLECVANTKKIQFHALELIITESKVMVNTTDGNELKLRSDFEYDKETEIFTINLEAELLAGSNYTVTVPYVAELGTNLYGFYRSSYVTNGQTHL